MTPQTRGEQEGCACEMWCGDWLWWPVPSHAHDAPGTVVLLQGRDFRSLVQPSAQRWVRPGLHLIQLQGWRPHDLFGPPLPLFKHGKVPLYTGVNNRAGCGHPPELLCGLLTAHVRTPSFGTQHPPSPPKPEEPSKPSNNLLQCRGHLQLLHMLPCAHPGPVGLRPPWSWC